MMEAATMQATQQPMKANYGLDAPKVVRNFFFCGAALMLVGMAGFFWLAPLIGDNATFVRIIVNIIAITIMISGLSWLITDGLMIWSSFYGKMQARNRLLDGLQLRGDETVLDVGCGRGLLLIGAAKRLSCGRVLGLDLWSQEDQSGNCKATTLANAAAEGVANRIEIHDGDMRKMPFANASVDVVVASLSIHNIYNREGRRRAINEIVRVLKPGGKVALMDMRHVKQYAQDLQVAGIRDVHVSGLNFWIYPPVRTVTGIKPISSHM